MTPGAGYGEIGMGTFRAIRPWKRMDRGAGATTSMAPKPDLRPEAVMPRIREMIGDPDAEVEIENVTTLADQPGMGDSVLQGPRLLRR